jgi:hypothetical protein
LDEAWAFLNVAQGETLSNKLVRAGRAMQAGVYFVTQSSGDVSKESLKNNIGLKFAFRSTDINEIKQTLEFFGIDKDDENNQKRLRDLENGQCLLQDLYGRVGVVQEQQSRQTGRLEKQEQRRQNIADKRMELQKAQEARQAQRKADGSATTGATRPHERPATASTIPKPSVEKMQEVKRPATATTSKISEPVKTSVIKERPLSSGASDRKASQPIQPAHRLMFQNFCG